jgi:hypothetical protein
MIKKYTKLTVTLSLVLVLGACSVGAGKFFDKVEKDRAAGAKWHYVGPSPLDPTSESLPLTYDGPSYREPIILFKLK